MGWAAAIPAIINAGVDIYKDHKARHSGNKQGGQGNSWSGSQGHMEQYDVLDKYQKRNLKDLNKNPDVNLARSINNPLYQEGGNFLQRILSQDPQLMQQFEAPALRQFQEQIVPGLAERFSGMGARSSSAFNQSMAGEAGSLSERLASMRAQLGMNASQQAFGYSQLPFQQDLQNQQMNLDRRKLGLGTQAFGNQYIPAEPGSGQAYMGAGGNALGQSAGQPGFWGGLWDSAKGMFGSSGSGKSNLTSGNPYQGWVGNSQPTPYSVNQYRIPGQM